MERDNITEVLEDVGAVVLANACGPCIGQVRHNSMDQVCFQTRLGSGNARIQRRGQIVGHMLFFGMYTDTSKAILTSFNR